MVQDTIASTLERLEARVRDLRGAQEAVAQEIAELERRLEAQTEFVQGVYERLAKKGERPKPRKG